MLAFNKQGLSFKNLLKTRKNRNKLVGLLFISPWLIGFFMFFLRNFISAFRFSFSKFTMLPNGGFSLNFIGIKNYVYAFAESSSFVKTLVDSLLNLLTDVPLIIFLSLFLAIILNGHFKGRIVVRTIFFLPIIFTMPTVVAALSGSVSTLGAGISSLPADMEAGTGLGLKEVLMQLTEIGLPEKVVTYIIGAVDRIFEIVKASGIQTLIFLAALQSIPHSLYEVSEIEGANAYETFWKITLPLVSPMVLINTVYTIVDSYVNSTILKVSYTATFVNMDFGMGAVYAIVGSFFICLILMLVSLAISRYVFYQS